MGLKEIFAGILRSEEKPEDPIKRLIKIVNTESRNEVALADQLLAIERLGENGSSKALKFLKQLYYRRSVHIESEPQGTIMQGIDVYPDGAANYTVTYSFSNARGPLRNALEFIQQSVTHYMEFAPVSGNYYDSYHTGVDENRGNVYHDGFACAVLTDQDISKGIASAISSSDEASRDKFIAHRIIRSAIRKLDDQLKSSGAQSK